MCVCHCVRNILQCNVGERVCAYVQHTIEECSKFESTFYRMRVSLYMDDYYTEIPHKKQTALLKTHRNDCKKPCHVFSGAFTALTSAFIHRLDYFSIFCILLQILISPIGFVPLTFNWIFGLAHSVGGSQPRQVETGGEDCVWSGADNWGDSGGWSRDGTILSLFNR